MIEVLFYKGFARAMVHRAAGRSESEHETKSQNLDHVV